MKSKIPLRCFIHQSLPRDLPKCRACFLAHYNANGAPLDDKYFDKVFILNLSLHTLHLLELGMLLVQPDALA